MSVQQGTDECGIGDSCEKQYQMASNSKFQSYDDRRRSFKNWPKSFAEFQIHNFCKAGFFYTGKSDKIECFFCGLRLCNWIDNEIPVEQHIIFSPKCAFLKMTKGREYIEQTRQKFVIRDDE